MPSLPAPLAARAEMWFGRPTTVTSIIELSPGLRRVTFHTPSMDAGLCVAGAEIEFLVSERDFRHYTPIPGPANTYDVVFARSTDGPGTAWAHALRIGDTTQVLGPARSVKRAPRELLLGDATAIGLFAAMLADAPGQVGAVEVPAGDRDAAAALLPGLDVVTTGERPGSALVAWLAATAHRVHDRAVLAGHAQSVQELRRMLRAAGTPRAAILTKASGPTASAGSSCSDPPGRCGRTRRG